MITCYKKRRIAQADAQCHLVKKFEGIVPPLRGSGIRLKLIYNHIIPSGFKAGTADMIVEKKHNELLKPGTGDILFLIK